MQYCLTQLSQSSCLHINASLEDKCPHFHRSKDAKQTGWSRETRTRPFYFHKVYGNEIRLIHDYLCCQKWRVLCSAAVKYSQICVPDPCVITRVLVGDNTRNEKDERHHTRLQQSSSITYYGKPRVRGKLPVTLQICLLPCQSDRLLLVFNKWFFSVCVLGRRGEEDSWGKKGNIWIQSRAGGV